MVLLLPDRLIAAKEGEKTAAAQFGAGGFDEEGAATAGADDGVDLLDQVIGEYDVCSL
jgi:hypothetical protein